MALNKQVFKTRAISAVAFAAIMLAGFFYNQWSFLLLFLIVHIGCWYEYLNLLEKIYNTKFNQNYRAGFIASGLSMVFLFTNVFQYNINNYNLGYNLGLPLSAAGVFLLIFSIIKSGKYFNAKAFIAAAAGFIYISFSIGTLVHLFQCTINTPASISNEYSHIFSSKAWGNGAIPAFLIFSIWINDTMAYITGSFIGKTPFSKISPKKTWEGTIGGALLCITIITLVGYKFFNNSWPLFLLISTVAAVAGTLGDLFESKLKRMANVKDSGNIMPGHGGFLDRFDSLLLAAPVCWLLIQLFY
jgi:phosphatidate cytidylyltransferase